MRKLFNQQRRATAARLALMAVAVATTNAHAAVDTTAITSALTDIAAVGTVVFGVYVAIKLTKWVRRAL